MGLLADRFKILAPDSYGSGQTPDWHSDRTISLQDEVDLLASVLEKAGEQVTLVGHSYGGAIALKIALLFPQRVKALALFEPTFFSVVEHERPSPNDVDGIRQAVAAAGAALDNGDSYLAARYFIDFWMGPGSWEKTPEERKPAVAESVRNVRRWGHALFSEPTALNSFSQLNVPVLYMVGGKSQLSAHAVAKRMVATLPNAELREFAQMGHMGPVTHPDVVNTAIAAFLQKVFS
jgi:pimeloyl-ACP methyl ester carboxylesterase